MNSAVLPSFWAEYRRLSIQVRQAARKSYRLWAENLFHPSLHFKCINSQESIWSVRITRNYCALGVLDGIGDMSILLGLLRMFFGLCNLNLR